MPAGTAWRLDLVKVLRGLGPERTPGATEHDAVHERVPRNAPALFNLGAREFTRLFHDGRVETDTAGYYEGGFITPAKWKLPQGLENVLAAQGDVSRYLTHRKWRVRKVKIPLPMPSH